MAKSTKTFKLGEWAKGGVITVNINGDNITVIGKEWDYSKGSRKSSDQSGAKEFTRLEVKSTEIDAYKKLLIFLQDLTTSYYADTILEWIESKTTLKKVWF